MALFNGDDDFSATIIAGNLEQAVNHLGADLLVMAECGHGFRSQRWEGENWVGHRYPFRVKSFVEMMADYIYTGRIKLDPRKIRSASLIMIRATRRATAASSKNRATFCANRDEFRRNGTARRRELLLRRRRRDALDDRIRQRPHRGR